MFSLCWWLCTVPGDVVLAGAILSGLAVAGFAGAILSGLAVAGFAGVRCAACAPLVVLILLYAGGELANEPQDLARAVFCLGFLEKIGKNPF